MPAQPIDGGRTTDPRRAAGGRRALGPLVLEYHAVSESWAVHRAVTPTELERQIAYLARRGYVGATFSDAASAMDERMVVFTFDDAHASVLELAFPRLAAAGFPGTVFVVTDFADDGRPLRWPGIHEDGKTDLRELRGMTWDELGGLVDAGWEVGSHTKTHPRLTSLEDAELDRELAESRAACERALGRPCRALAYPFGDHDARVVSRAAAAGYSLAAMEGLGPVAPLAWPRIGVYRHDRMWRFRLKVSSTVRHARTFLEPRARRPAGPAQRGPSPASSADA